MDIKLLVATVQDLFTKRSSLVSRWQEIGDNFYPERADFTVNRTLGDQFAEHLMTSYPIQCRRELGDQIGSMLRPTSKEWAKMETTDRERQSNEAKRWLEMADGIQRRAMYDRKSQFTRATKEGDHDFAAFGQCVLSVRLNRNLDGLLYRCWHLRDVVWMEGEDGEVNFTARKWKPYLKDLVTIFGGKNHQKVMDAALKTPFKEHECLHIICDIEMFDGNGEKANRKLPYWTIYYDVPNNHILEAIPTWNKEYAIPRWQTVSGSQYAFSPATIVALPDARLIQAMTYTLLEAGEKATNPPMIATKDAVRSDISIYAGGITWVDQDYDERLGASLRPIDQDYRQLPIGLDMQQDSRLMLRQAFFLNKLNLPERTPDATAYEIGQRVQEYIRGAMPIFEPMEMNYNGQIMELTFDLLMRANAFGSPFDIPKELQGAEIQFRFESPLHDAIEMQKGNKFMEMKALIREAVELDQDALTLPNMTEALRDALMGIQVPAKWLNTPQEVQAKVEQNAEQMQMAQTLAAAEQGGKAANSLAGAEKSMSEVNSG